MGADRDLIARYELLADLAEAESAAASTGDLHGLTEAIAAREVLRATLPATAPAEARPALERALTAQQAATHSLRVGVAQARAGMAKLQRGSVQVRGYGGVAKPLVDASS